MLRFSDARNFGRTLTGLCLLSALVLFLVSSIVSPNVDHDNKLRELAAVSAHKGSYLTSGYLFLIAGIFVMVAAIGLVRFFRGPRGVTAGQVGACLLVIGAADLFAFFAFTIVEYEMVNQKGLNTPALAQYLDKVQDSGTAFPLFIVFLVGVVLGLILLAVAMYRTRVVPVWASAAVLIGAVLNIFDGTGFEIASNVVLLLGLGTLAMRILTMSDEEWDSPRVRKEAPAGPEPSAPTPAPAA